MAESCEHLTGLKPEDFPPQTSNAWAVWHWGRTLLGLAGFVATVVALQSSDR